MLLPRAGKDPRQAQRWLGHSQLTTTMTVYLYELDDGPGGADVLEDDSNTAASSWPDS